MFIIENILILQAQFYHFWLIGRLNLRIAKLKTDHLYSQTSILKNRLVEILWLAILITNRPIKLIGESETGPYYNHYEYTSFEKEFINVRMERLWLYKIFKLR